MTDEEEIEISKALGQFQFRVRELLQPLRLYGQSEYCTMVEEQFTRAAWQLHHRLQGLDIPIEVEVPHW